MDNATARRSLDNDKPDYSSRQPAPILLDQSGMKQVGLLLVEQSVISAAEVQVTTDRSLPVIGLLYGCLSTDGDIAILRSLQRIPRHAESLLKERRIIPGGIEFSRRIKIEDFTLLGYYYSVVEKSPYSVDHETICVLLNEAGCKNPITLQISRTVINPHAEGARFDFFTYCDRLSLRPLSLKIIDPAYISRSILINSQVELDLEEAISQRNVLSKKKINVDAEYDSFLTTLLISMERKMNNISWNLQSRLALDKMFLKELVRNRLTEVEKLWADRTFCESTSLDGGDLSQPSTTPTAAQRVAALTHQMIMKELPYAHADSMKKLPTLTTNSSSGHERPTIAMKTARGSPTVKKRSKPKSGSVKSGATVTKGPPRPILPNPTTNGRSRTSSTESFVAIGKEAINESSMVITESMLLSKAPAVTKMDPLSPQDEEHDRSNDDSIPPTV